MGVQSVGPRSTKEMAQLQGSALVMDSSCLGFSSRTRAVLGWQDLVFSAWNEHTPISITLALPQGDLEKDP